MESKEYSLPFIFIVGILYFSEQVLFNITRLETLYVRILFLTEKYLRQFTELNPTIVKIFQIMYWIESNHIEYISCVTKCDWVTMWVTDWQTAGIARVAIRNLKLFILYMWHYHMWATLSDIGNISQQSSNSDFKH